VTFLYNLVLVLHFLGLASLIGAWLTQVRGDRYIHPAMLHGALTMVITGVIMTGLAEGVESVDRDLDNAKIGTKLLVALIITVLAWINRRRGTIPNGLYFLLGGLAVANVVIAVFWR